MADWVSEANWPEAWTTIYFSPMVVSGSNHIVYVGGQDVQKFYSYNLDTDTWTELTAPPISLYGSIAMSPNGAKLVAVGLQSKTLRIYDIVGNSWASSSAAPNITGGAANLYLHTFVWADDNDTIWCEVQGYSGAYWRAKIYNYVVSTDTWTQYTNYEQQTYQNGYCMSINTAGTVLYVGHVGANIYSGLKYVIATDTYSLFSIGSTYSFYFAGDRAARLWIWAAGVGIKYYDCDVEAASDVIFPVDAGRDKTSDLTAGLYGVVGIIAHHVTTEPKNRSYLIITSPTVTTNAATSVVKASATLDGTLDSDGDEACDCGFEYGETEAYGTITPTESKNTGQTFSQAITGLSPNTTYHYRAIATNSVGTAYGSDQTFTTLIEPIVTTDPATSVEETTATLNGILDDDGNEACDCGFEYGETTAYGTTTTTQSKTSSETFSQAISGLSPGAHYHFRAIATNSAGTTYGSDRGFFARGGKKGNPNLDQRMFQHVERMD